MYNLGLSIKKLGIKIKEHIKSQNKGEEINQHDDTLSQPSALVVVVDMSQG